MSAGHYCLPFITSRRIDNELRRRVTNTHINQHSELSRIYWILFVFQNTSNSHTIVLLVISIFIRLETIVLIERNSLPIINVGKSAENCYSHKRFELVRWEKRVQFRLCFSGDRRVRSVANRRKLDLGMLEVKPALLNELVK